jgi:hypothetical protein
MPDIGETGAPLGYLGLGEAYEQAWRALHDAEALVAGVWPSRTKRRRMHAKAPAEERPVDYAPLNDPDGEGAYDNARWDVELRLRTALAKGELDAFTRDPRTGEILRGYREGWTQSMSPPGFGLSNEIHNATCPGPVELEGRFVFLDAIKFKAWLEREVSASKTQPISTRALKAAYLEHVKQIGPAGHSSREDDLDAMLRRFPGAEVTKAQVAILRRKYAPAEWKAPGKRKR